MLRSKPLFHLPVPKINLIYGPRIGDVSDIKLIRTDFYFLEKIFIDTISCPTSHTFTEKPQPKADNPLKTFSLTYNRSTHKNGLFCQKESDSAFKTATGKLCRNGAWPHTKPIPIPPLSNSIVLSEPATQQSPSTLCSFPPASLEEPGRRCLNLSSCGSGSHVRMGTEASLLCGCVLGLPPAATANFTVAGAIRITATGGISIVLLLQQLGWTTVCQSLVLPDSFDSPPYSNQSCAARTQPAGKVQELQAGQPQPHWSPAALHSQNRFLTDSVVPRNAAMPQDCMMALLHLILAKKVEKGYP